MSKKLILRDTLERLPRNPVFKRPTKKDPQCKCTTCKSLVQDGENYCTRLSSSNEEGLAEIYVVIKNPSQVVCDHWRYFL